MDLPLTFMSSICLIAFWIFPLLHVGVVSSVVPEEECRAINGVEIRYSEFYELYLGHNPDTNELQESGIIYHSLKHAVNACCPGMPLNFTEILNKSIEELVEDDILYHHEATSNNSNLVFYFPEFNKQGKLELYSHELPFLKLRKSPGFALVMLKSESHLNISASDVLAPSWPIFALILALSWAVGILGWALDHIKNPKDFPKPFVRGMFSGFWWAIVTMTTVGYGDKTTKSFLARLLCVVWILAGAVFLSLFTSNTTSNITASRIDQNGQTMGKKVGVVNMRDFVESELNLGANFVEFNSVEKALISLKEKKIDRLLFPHYLDLLFFMSDQEFSDLGHLSEVYIAKVFDTPFEIGMVLSHGQPSDLRKSEFYSCLQIMTSRFSREVQYDYSKIDQSVANAFGDTFDTDVTIQFLYAILGIILTMLIIGCIYDALRYFRKKRKKNLSDPAQQIELV